MYRIFHIADVHWRGLSRHTEYITVFNALVQDAIKYKPDAIYVAGDIFHTKTSGISPEIIEIIANWMKQLATIAPTYMILGNHDSSLSNSERQDAITPIYNLVKEQFPDRLFLYKYSGVYDFLPGMKLCVFSLYDDNWECVKPIEGYINVATYHGPVTGAKTEQEFEVAGDVSIEMFKDYDFCWLGDIHATQFLGERPTKAGVNRPWIAYPGSTIQQNYAEALEHGYLMWDITDKDDFDVSFKILPNPKPFITLNWKGNVEETLQQTKIKTDSRVRIKSDTFISQADVSELSNRLNYEHNSTELTFKIDTQQEQQTISISDQNNLRNYETLLSLIKEQNKEATNINWSNVEQLLKQYLTTLGQDKEVARYTKWSLSKLKFDNLFTYGESNVIDFSKLKGITGIFGPNRVGKSSITGAILYALFNASDRGSIKNIAICNVRKQYCSATVELVANGQQYVLERQTVKKENKKGEVNASTALNLFEICSDGSKRDLCGDGRIDSDKEIRKLIGTSDDLLLTGISTQGDLEQFVKNKSTNRWQTLARFLDIDFFGELHKLANEECKTIKAQLKNYPDKNWTELAKSLQEKYKECENIITEQTQLFETNNVKLQQLKYEFEQKKDQEFVSKEQFDTQKNKLNLLQESKNQCFQRIYDNKQQIIKLEDEIKTINISLQSYDIDVLSERVKLLNEQQQKLNQVSTKYSSTKTSLNIAKKNVKLLDVIPCHDAFPNCDFIKDAHVSKTQLQQLTDDFTQVTLQQDILTKLVNDLIAEKNDSKLEIVSKLKAKLTMIETKILQLTNENLSLNIKLSNLTTQLESAILEHDKLEVLYQDSENKRLVQITEELQDVQNKVKICDALKLEAATKKGKIENEILCLRTEKKTRNELLTRTLDYDVITNAFSKRGLPKQIIGLKLPLINAEITKILSGIVSYVIEFEEDSETDKLEIYLNYGDSRRIIELGSGMEKMIASIAIRTALFNISTLPKPDFFIIDEGFGSLDDGNIEACVRLLKSLTQYFKSILIISHIDAIKDAVDNMLEITKVDKDSSIVYN